MPPIFQTQSGVTLVGGAGFDAAALGEALALAPDLVAADGGANHLDDMGHTPRAVIGDLDSIRPELRDRLGARVHHIPEQDSTDLDKCLRSIDAPFLLGVGFLGARLDHTFAAMASLVQHGRARVLLVGPQDICLLLPPRLEMRLPQDAPVSLVPMGPVTGQSRGLHWPIDGIDFAPDGRIGTSNRMAGDRLELTVSAPKMLLMLERRALGATLDAVISAPDW
ncbi:thiamine diphosphokinase [Roseibaca sp. Y0-43]|uniref:thiamine diphosphokinase n=1 Tax=Roseibaca sp. Y0-43 TaxID=2816854 RepID=UPI001D0C0667|nr:thiamine diphosphokinase [Roseibaca sp. Y0-43]MCC1480234.1 thiamine diphosphokinase [Roseibaca sp. Y0-43]